MSFVWTCYQARDGFRHFLQRLHFNHSGFVTRPRDRGNLTPSGTSVRLGQVMSTTTDYKQIFIWDKHNPKSDFSRPFGRLG